MKVSTENDNNFGYEKITILVDKMPLRRNNKEMLNYIFDFQDLLYITQAHMCNISKHNNIIQYVNIENMGDREGIYFRLIHYIQYTFNI